VPLDVGGAERLDAVAFRQQGGLLRGARGGPGEAPVGRRVLALIDPHPACLGRLAGVFQRQIGIRPNRPPRSTPWSR